MLVSQEASQQTINECMFYTLRQASSAVHFRELPYPCEWNPLDRPHVALLLCEDGYVFRFYLSTPCVESKRLHVWNPQRLAIDSLVEVKYNDMDLRYYRREKNMWALVGESRTPAYNEFNEYGILLLNGWS